MDDMQTFEREIAGVIRRAISPARPVDAMAVARAAATQSPKRRFQSMFSATKYVVAGVIVALFGGFLLVTLPIGEPARNVSAPAASAPGTFSPAGSMPEPRPGHTATLLPDGRVLVLGGCCEAPGIEDPTAVVWDPETSAFSEAGSLAVPRGGYTATPLLDGRVLVVGGWTDTEAGLASAEIWDPETMTFSPAGALSRGRSGHTATALPDGRVVVIGGMYEDPTSIPCSFLRSGIRLPRPSAGQARSRRFAGATPPRSCPTVGCSSSAATTGANDERPPQAGSGGLATCHGFLQPGGFAR